MRASALLQLAVCAVVLACLSSTVAVSAQVIPSPLTPTDDSITNLVYAFTLNGTSLRNGTVDAWNPIYCAPVNGASVLLQSRTGPAHDKADYLEYNLTAQAFLHSTNCTGVPRPTVVGVSGEVPNQPSHGALLPYHFHSFPESELNGLTIVGSLSLEIPARSSSSSTGADRSSSSSTGPSPIPPPSPKPVSSSSSSTGPAPTPAPQPEPYTYSWSLHYDYLYKNMTYTGISHADHVCTAITGGNFSLRWDVDASSKSNHTGLLLGTSMVVFAGSLDCTGDDQPVFNYFEYVADEPGTLNRTVNLNGAKVPAGLTIRSTYFLTIARQSASSSSTGPVPIYSSSSTGPAPLPPQPNVFSFSLNYDYSYRNESAKGTHQGDSVCTLIKSGNFSLRWTARASIEPNHTAVLLNNTLLWYPFSTDCTGQDRLLANDFEVVANVIGAQTRPLNVTRANLPAGLLVRNSYVFTIAPPAPQPTPSSSGGNEPEHDGGMSKGTKIALIVLGSVAGAVALVVLLFCACKKKKVEQQYNTGGQYQSMAR